MKKDLPFSEGATTDSERIKNVLRIIKAIHLTIESGGIKDENLNPEAVEDAESKNATMKGEEGLNSMAINFIMGRKPAT